uniref:Uncharacterized protein n=1 Tax=Cannabis sativa TaxID=3483 RepID=A0A803PGU9_CANSA
MAGEVQAIPMALHWAKTESMAKCGPFIRASVAEVVAIRVGLYSPLELLLNLIVNVKSNVLYDVLAIAYSVQCC